MLAEIEQGVGRRAQPRQISPAFVHHFVQVLDPALIGILGLVSYFIYLQTRHDTPFESPYIVTILMGVVISTVLFHWFDVYARECMFSRRLSIQRLLLGWAVTVAVLLFVAFAMKTSSTFSRIWTVTWFAGSAGLLVFARLAVGQWVANRVREGALGERAVIFGAGEQGQRFAAQLQDHGDPCLKVLGFVDDRQSRVPRSSHGLDILGDAQDLLSMIRANLVDQVFVALPWSAKDRLSELMNQLAVAPVRVSLVTDPFGFELPNRSVRFIDNIPTLQVFDRPLTGWSYVTKGIEDRVIAALILVFITPLMLLIALGIKLDSPGPVLFRQKRYGFNNNLIEVWKFRSMFTDQTDQGGARQATKNDPRVTRFGAFLRKTSLDELPQFFNVLLGDMSIVGPRPHPVELTSHGRRFEEIVDRYAARHKVKPGITGWAQVNGWRGETDTVEKVKARVEHDLYYIDNWSVWLDLTIILKTVVVIFKDESAY